MTMRFFAIQCTACNDVLISRAGHDFNRCSCEDMLFIDGNSSLSGDGYYRVGYNITEARPSVNVMYVDLPITPREAYDDWNKRIDKWKKIDITKYPPIEIPKESDKNK